VRRIFIIVASGYVALGVLCLVLGLNREVARDLLLLGLVCAVVILLADHLRW